MHKIFSWVTTLIFLIPFTLIFLVFHVIQVITLNLFGYQAHKKALDYMQFCFIAVLNIAGVSLKIKKWKEPLPRNRPLIIVSNHQSIFDIPFIIWVFRRHHPKFVAKKELGKGIPGVSYHLKYGGNALIDRNDTAQSLQAIGNLGEYIEKYNRSAVIYPEGSRSRNGILKEFKTGGLFKLMEKSPSALIVPVAIENSWKIVRYNLFPVPFGIGCKLTVLEPIESKELSQNQVIQLIEEKIRKAIHQEKVQKKDLSTK